MTPKHPRARPSAYEPLPQTALALAARVPEGYAMRALVDQSSDREAIAEHWINLDPEGSRTRFFGSSSAYSLMERAKKLDFANPRLVGIFCPAGKLACLAEWSFNPRSDPGERIDLAEAAFSTLAAHRRQGLAKLAMAASALDAKRYGVRRLAVESLRENKAAQGLGASLGALPAERDPMDFESDDLRHLDLDAQGPMSIEFTLGLPL